MDLQIFDVRAELNGPLRQEIIQFWVGEGALTPEQAEGRVAQVFQIIRRKPQGQMLGICTLHPLFVDSMNCQFFNYRSYIAKDYRSLGLVSQLCIASYDLLNAEFQKGQQPEVVGMFLEIENPQLKARNQAIWESPSCFTFIGFSPKGHHIRVAYFQGARVPVNPYAGEHLTL